MCVCMHAGYSCDGLQKAVSQLVGMERVREGERKPGEKREEEGGKFSHSHILSKDKRDEGEERGGGKRERDRGIDRKYRRKGGNRRESEE